jgi:hypothetical protein
MPAQDMSSKIGTSPSPAAQAAINTGKNSQCNTTDVASALRGQTTNNEASIPGKK